MAVYTKLTHLDISRHLSNYQIGELVKFEEIIEGIDNSNFVLFTSEGKFILTIFESRINKAQLPFFINFELHLARNGIDCPRPIFDNQGLAIADLCGKRSAIVTFLSGKNLKPRADGYYDNITAKHCAEVGRALAQMHLAAQDFLPQQGKDSAKREFLLQQDNDLAKQNSLFRRENDLGAKDWRLLFSKIEGLIKNFYCADFLISKKNSDPVYSSDFLQENLNFATKKQNLHAEILDAITFLEKAWRLDLPSAAAHLDLFPDNIFFDENKKVSGVIDFYFAANEALIYDFAIAANAWCFDENNNFSEEKFLSLKNGYENFRKFSPQELDFLPIALCGAALRFLLTRLHDMFFTPKNSLVKIKDPQEYLAKLRFFRKLI